MTHPKLSSAAALMGSKGGSRNTPQQQAARKANAQKCKGKPVILSGDPKRDAANAQRRAKYLVKQNKILA